MQFVDIDIDMQLVKVVVCWRRRRDVDEFPEIVRFKYQQGSLIVDKEGMMQYVYVRDRCRM